MNEPEGTGTHPAEGPDEGIALPSWIDEAIAKSQGESAPPEVARHTVEPLDEPEAAPTPPPEATPSDFQPLGGHEWMAEQERAMTSEPVGEEAETMEDAVFGVPAAGSQSEPFPSFLGRPGPLPAEEPSPEPLEEDPESVDVDAWTEFEGEDSPVFAKHERPETVPMPEPVPLPEAPVRRRGLAGPWLMAALFFAAAALALAVLIWLKPLPR